jgi:hypothetical protein
MNIKISYIPSSLKKNSSFVDDYVQRCNDKLTTLSQFVWKIGLQHYGSASS